MSWIGQEPRQYAAQAGSISQLNHYTFGDEWVVWHNPGTGYSLETRRFPTEAAANTRADQLAKANPGHEYYVARLTSRRRVPTPSVEISRPSNGGCSYTTLNAI